MEDPKKDLFQVLLLCWILVARVELLKQYMSACAFMGPGWGFRFSTQKKGAQVDWWCIVRITYMLITERDELRTLHFSSFFTGLGIASGVTGCIYVRKHLLSRDITLFTFLS